MAQTSRDSPVAVIPQAVTPRTPPTGRSGTHKAHARGGAGAGEPPPSGMHGNFGVVVGVADGVCVGVDMNSRLRTPTDSWPAIGIDAVADD